MSLGLLSSQYSHFTEMSLRDIMICRRQRVCSCQSFQRRVSLVREKFFPGFTPRLMFSCEFSFALISFLGGGVFESSTTFLLGSTGS